MHCSADVLSNLRPLNSGEGNSIPYLSGYKTGFLSL